jgi:hypothetical protein
MIKASLVSICEFAVALGIILAFATASSGQNLTTTGIGLVGGWGLRRRCRCHRGRCGSPPSIKGALIGSGLCAVAGGILGNAPQKQ